MKIGRTAKRTPYRPWAKWRQLVFFAILLFPSLLGLLVLSIFGSSADYHYYFGYINPNFDVQLQLLNFSPFSYSSRIFPLYSNIWTFELLVFFTLAIILSISYLAKLIELVVSRYLMSLIWFAMNVVLTLGNESVLMGTGRVTRFFSPSYVGFSTTTLAFSFPLALLYASAERRT